MSVRKKSTGTPKTASALLSCMLASTALWAQAGDGADTAGPLLPSSPEFWAGAPALASPVDCVTGAGRRCRISAYVDHNLGDGLADYQCRARTYNGTSAVRRGHDATDIGFVDWSSWVAGGDVSVTAAAFGRVINLRTGIADSSERDTPSTLGCGNNVLLDHGGGWLTRYCHMKDGSITAQKGDMVAAGDRLGAIGSSGWSSFPHVHFEVVRQVGDRLHYIDPFSGTTQDESCRRFRQSMWTPTARSSLAYTPIDILKIGFAATQPTSKGLLKDDQAAEHLSWSSPTGIWPFFYVAGWPEGDFAVLSVTGPEGRKLFKATVKLEAGGYRAFRTGNLATSKAVQAMRDAGEALPTGVFRLKVQFANVARRVYASYQAQVKISR